MRFFALSMTLLAALAFTTGCGSCGGDKNEAQPEASTQSAPESTEQEQLEEDASPLDVESEETPEGVVNSFFRTFFRGDSDGAFALLSEKARESQSENFAAQASDTIRWRIVQKTKPTNRGRVYVWVDVEDYAESGEVQRDTLSFVLTNNDAAWRVCGFNVGDAAVDFEESVIVAQEAPAAPIERTATRLDETNTRR